MKWLALLLALVSLALIGCKSGGSGGIVGSWKVDTSAFPDFDKMPEQNKAGLEKLRVVFNADKTTLSDDGAGNKEPGTWELKGKDLTVTSHKMTKSGVYDNNSITFTNEGLSLRLIKE